MTIQPTRSDARENRRRIIQAAREVLAEEGIGAEVKVIAERASVGVGTVYRNFATKEGLIVAMVSELLAEFREGLAAVEAVEDSVEALMRLLAHGFGMAEHSGALFVALMQGGVDPRGLGEDIVSRVARVLQRGAHAGTLRQDVDARFMAEYIKATMPLLYLQLRGRYTAEETAENCTRLLLAAMVAPGTAMEPLMERWRFLS
jgi:AcrR family transcriptional regulator